MAGLDVINKRIRKSTIRERIKKAYTDPNRAPKPPKFAKLDPDAVLHLSRAGELAEGPWFEVEGFLPVAPTQGVFYIDGVPMCYWND